VNQPTALSTFDPERILVVLPTWVGDFVMATPVLRAIRTRFRASDITFLTVRNLSDLIDGGDWMDHVVVWQHENGKGGLGALMSTAKTLRQTRFDLAVLFPNSFRSALLARLAGARRRIGYNRDGRGFLLTDRLTVSKVGGTIQPHPICEDYAQIAVALGCPEPGDQLELFTTPSCEHALCERLAEEDIADDRPLVVISPGASFGSSKLWLPERFAAVANRLASSHGASIVITCGPGEESIARKIVAGMGAGATVFDDPRLTLGELKGLIQRADLLVCNDSGPRHIAKAFNIPIVTVFGSTHQRWTDTDYPLERKVSIPVDCGPCQKKTCPLVHLDCLTGVSVDMVHDRCVELLERRPERVAC